MGVMDAHKSLNTPAGAVLVYSIRSLVYSAIKCAEAVSNFIQQFPPLLFAFKTECKTGGSVYGNTHR